MRKFTQNNLPSKLTQSSFAPYSVESRKRRNRMIAAILLLLIVGGSGFFVMTSYLIPRFKRLSFFEFKEIIVNPTEHTSEDEIKRIVGKPSGENMFDLDLEKIKEKLNSHPWILDVKVTRLLPDRIRIEIVEKKPVAILARAHLFFLDRKGNIIAPIRPQNIVNFPIISGIKTVDEAMFIRKAYRLIKLYRKQDFLKQWPVSEVHWGEKNGFVIYTKDPLFEVRLGQGKFKKKISRLERVLKDLYQKDIVPKVVDLNFSKKVVVKLTQ